MSADTRPRAVVWRHRALIMAGVLATYMQAFNISVPNAAVLHVQGGLSMTDDEIGWVFSSYIAAGALVMPMTHWLAGRFGRKRIFLLSLALFAVALVLDTWATTPLSFVGARIIQGAASGTLAPLSMAILLDELPPLRHGHIGPTWSVTAMLGIVSGPAIGGWLSEFHGWHSIFYLSLPIAIGIFLVVALCLHEKKAPQSAPFDFFGFAAFSVGIAGLQMLLDRGERLEWFASTEIRVEAIAASLGCYLYLMHALTRKNHYLNTTVFRDRNFSVATAMYFIYGFVLLPTLALTSPMLEELLGYPADTAGYLTLPRGAALVGGLILTWRVPSWLDNRIFVLGGAALSALGTWLMLGYSPVMDASPVMAAGALQGAGLGMLLPALSRAAFSTLDPVRRSEATVIFNLARLFGSTLGISVVQIFFYANTQGMHLALAKHLRPYGPVARTTGHLAGSQLALLNEAVTGQAAVVAVIGQFKLLLVAMLVASPLAFFLRKPRTSH